jgi:hypothetical protein
VYKVPDRLNFEGEESTVAKPAKKKKVLRVSKKLEKKQTLSRRTGGFD